MNKVFTLLLITIIVLASMPSYAQVKDAPANVSAALLIKLASFNKGISSQAGDLEIYVANDPAVAAELEKGIGKAIGKATLKKVVQGEGVPANKPHIVFIGKSSNVDELTAYTRKNGVMSSTGSPDLVAKGVNLGIGIGDDNKPKIMLNLSATAEENIDWNPAIMKVAKTI